jgi:ComF family protein
MPTLKNKLSNYLHGIAQLIYPLQCNGCGSDLVSKENLLCLPCLQKLPETNFHSIADNYVEKIFYGRLPIAAATSLFFFSKDSLLQHLLHQLKYKGNQDIGFYFGKMLGRRFKETNRFNGIDFITPIPLSKKRLQKRGYNQAMALSKGLSEELQIPILDNLTIRKKDNETQTNKSRTERWENMQDCFFVENEKAVEDKSILLVDDVITTGATIEACGASILKISNTKLSIASIAIATN